MQLSHRWGRVSCDRQNLPKSDLGQHIRTQSCPKPKKTNTKHAPNRGRLVGVIHLAKAIVIPTVHPNVKNIYSHFCICNTKILYIYFGMGQVQLNTWALGPDATT